MRFLTIQSISCHSSERVSMVVIASVRALVKIDVFIINVYLSKRKKKGFYNVYEKKVSYKKVSKDLFTSCFYN